MSTKSIVTPAEARAFIFRAIDRQIGGPGATARIPEFSLEKGAGTVVFSISYSTWAARGEDADFINQEMQLVLHSDHVHGSARITGVVVEFGFVEQSLKAASDAFGLPYEWTFLMKIDSGKGRYTIEVTPLFSQNQEAKVNAA